MKERHKGSLAARFMAWVVRRWGHPKPDLNAPRCVYCDQPIEQGQWVGRNTAGGYIHAGFQRDGSFCETGGIASHWYDGEKFVQINWDEYYG